MPKSFYLRFIKFPMGITVITGGIFLFIFIVVYQTPAQQYPPFFGS